VTATRRKSQDKRLKEEKLIPPGNLQRRSLQQLYNLSAETGAGRKVDLNIVYSDCCGGGYHRDCVQSMAVSAGNTHFRCPNCADHGAWVETMLEAGIYVPEQDASWEREGGYYDEVDREPVRLCHAKLCFSSLK